MRLLGFGIGLVVASVAWPLTAESGKLRPPIEVTVVQTVNLPFQTPEVIVSAGRSLTQVRVDVIVNGRSVARANYDRLDVGRPRALTWQASAGKQQAEVRVQGTSPSGPFDHTESARIDVVPALELRFGAADVNLSLRKLEFRATSDVAFAELTLFDMEGRELHHLTQSFDHDRPGKPNALTWPRLDAPVARLALRVFGNQDSWADAEWSPILIDVPHGPIFFDDMLAQGKRPQLDQAYRDIVKARRENANQNGLRLYLLGVPSEPAQADLAAERARAFGKYLRSRGLDLPIMVAASDEPKPDAAHGGGQLQAILAVQDPEQASWSPLR